MQRFNSDNAARVEAILRKAASRIAALHTLAYGPAELCAQAEQAENNGLVELGQSLRAVSSAETQLVSGPTAPSSNASGGVPPELHRAAADLLARHQQELRGDHRYSGSNNTSNETLSSRLQSLLRSLADISAQRLKTTSAQHADIATEIRNRRGRVDNAERELAQLRDELQKQRDARSKRIEAITARSSSLQDELSAVRHSCEEEMTSIVSSSVSKQRSVADSQQRQQSALRAQLDEGMLAHKKLVEEHTELEAAQRLRSAQALSDAQETQREYDATLGELRDAIASVRSQIDALGPPLVDVRRYYERVRGRGRHTFAYACLRMRMSCFSEAKTQQLHTYTWALARARLQYT